MERVSNKLAKSNGNGKKMGRPTKYQPHHPKLAFNFCLLGATDSQLSDFFQINELTLNRWKKAYPNFSKSLKTGKLLADSMVSKSLYRQALAGNVTACIFWLKNRQPALWRDKHDIDVKGAVLHLSMDLGDGKAVELNSPPEAIEGEIVEGEGDE